MLFNKSFKILMLPLLAGAASFFALAAAAAPASSPNDLPPGYWAGGSVKRVLHEKIMGTTKDGRFRGDQPVTRYELAVALDRFVQYIEEGHKPLHAQAFRGPSSIPASASIAQREALKHLISNGFLPAGTPLLTKDGRAPVTAKETSDALASVTIRLSDRAEAPQAN